MTWVYFLKVQVLKEDLKNIYQNLDDLANLLIHLAVKARAQKAWYTK